MSDFYNKNKKKKPSNEDYDYEEEGVFYTPTSNKGKGPANKPPSRQPAQRSANNPKSSGRAPLPKAGNKTSSRQINGKKKTNYAYFYIITLVVAVVVCLVVFFLVFNSVVGGGKDKTPVGTETTAKPSPQSTDTPVEAVNQISIIGVINKLSTVERKIEIFDIENLKTYKYNIGGATTLKNKYGEVMSLSEFKVGDIVDARVPEESEILSDLSISALAWEQRQITNAKINTQNATIVIGNETFKYDREKTKVMYENEEYDISKIDPLNVITLKGMNDVCWYIEVEKAVGTIEFTNGEGIREGIIEIDNNNIRILMEEDGKNPDPIKVQEGIRRYVIKGANIEPFTGEIEVISGEVTTLDLSKVVVTAGSLNVTVNVSDAKVSINGKEVRDNEPQVLPYGKYKLKVEKEGYETFEGEVEIDTPTKDHIVTLMEAVKMKQLNITTVPTGADVYVDNQYIGLSPVTTQVPEDAKTLTLKKTGYNDVTIYILDGENNYQITLRQDLSGSSTQTPSSVEPTNPNVTTPSTSEPNPEETPPNMPQG